MVREGTECVSLSRRQRIIYSCSALRVSRSTYITMACDSAAHIYHLIIVLEEDAQDPVRTAQPEGIWCTHPFVCSHKTAAKEGKQSDSTGNSRVSHYGCTYIQDCHMASSCGAISIKTHAQ